MLGEQIVPEEVFTQNYFDHIFGIYTLRVFSGQDRTNNYKKLASRRLKYV